MFIWKLSTAVTAEHHRWAEHRSGACAGKSVRQGFWCQDLIISVRHNKDTYENPATDEGLYTVLSLVSYIFILNTCIYLV